MNDQNNANKETIIDSLNTAAAGNRKVLEMIAGMAGINLPEKVKKAPKSSSPYKYTDKDLVDLGKTVSESVEAVKANGVTITKDYEMEDDLYVQTMTQLINKRTSYTVRSVVNPEDGALEMVLVKRPEMTVVKSESVENLDSKAKAVLVDWAREIFPNGVLGAKDNTGKTYLVGVGNKKAMFIKTQEYK